MVEETKAASTEKKEVVAENKSTNNNVDLSSFYGIKAGMTRVFDKHGSHVPVTVIKLISNIISQVKTKNKDGYEAYQVAYQEKRSKLVSKPKHGHLKKAGIDKSLNRFFELRTENVDEANVGKEISLDMFKSIEYIDATSISKGKGFQGVMKKYNFSGGPASHGSKTHRAPGSIGQCASPGRVFKNKKLPGHMGSEKKTVQNIRLFEVNKEKGYLLIGGSVPGAKNSFIKISKAIKK